MHSVSIVIPCYQERTFIRGCLESVRAFRIPAGITAEILVLDGRSSDGTRDIVEEVAASDARIRLIDNPNRTQAAALNIAIGIAAGDYLVRLDAHSVYPPDYLELTLETALRTNSDNTGGNFVTIRRGDHYQAALVQALTTHKFGVGDASFRTGGAEGPADTVPYGCFKRAIFARVGMFDERLARAQDYEMNRRILAAGGSVWRNPAIRVSYFQQPDLISFMRKQILHEAPYNAYLWYLAPYAFAPRHAITGAFAAGIIVGVPLSVISPTVRAVFAGVMGLYVLLAFLAAVQQALRYREPRHALFLPFGFFLYHFLHGIGVLGGLLRLATRTSPVQKVPEPWTGAGRFRAWPRSDGPGAAPST